MKKIFTLIVFVFIGLSTAKAQRPYFQWVRGFGEGFTETDVNSATDKWGNVYIVGGTGEQGAGNTSDFHPDPGVVLQFETPFSYSQEDIFVTKMDASGNHLWTNYRGGFGYDHVFAMSIDFNGNLYITGVVEGDSLFQWPDTVNPVCIFSPSAGLNSFVMKMDSSGAIVWARRGLAPSPMGDFITVSTSPNGEVYLGSNDGYMTKLDAGGSLLWSAQCPWMNSGVASVAVSPDGKLFSASITSDISGVQTLRIAKIDTSNGNSIWQDSLVGSGQYGFGGGVALQYDNNGAIYLMGEFYGTVDFDPSVQGAMLLTSDSALVSDVFVLKLDTLGGFEWAKHYPGAIDVIYSGCTGNSISVDQDGGVCMMSRMPGASMDADPDTANSFFINCSTSGYAVIRLNADGSFRWAFSIDNGWSFVSVSVDVNRSIILSGRGSIPGTDYDPGPGFATWPEGECFVLKLDEFCLDPAAGSDICIVTVDTVTGDNVIVWEKSNLIGVDSFSIKKDLTGTGNYSTIGTVGANALSVFTDLNSSQSSQSSMYAISIKDSCGTDYPVGAVHKTMHLQVDFGGTGDSLTWNAYEGLFYQKFYIMSGSSPTALVIIDSLLFIPGTSTYTYVRTTHTASAYYAIEIRTTPPCAPTARMSTVPYGFSRSNVFAYFNTAIAEPPTDHLFALYPNPAVSALILEFMFEAGSETEVTLMDCAGRIAKKELVRTQGPGKSRFEFNLKGTGEEISSGVYLISVKCGGRTETKRLIVL